MFLLSLADIQYHCAAFSKYKNILKSISVQCPILHPILHLFCFVLFCFSRTETAAMLGDHAAASCTFRRVLPCSRILSLCELRSLNLNHLTLWDYYINLFKLEDLSVFLWIIVKKLTCCSQVSLIFSFTCISFVIVYS